MEKSTQVMLKSIIGNIFLVFFKIIGGLVLKSSSLLADGIHSLSDFITDIVAILGNIMSLKPADDKHPYGHGKIEYVTSIFIGATIIIVGLFLLLENGKSRIIIPNKLVLLVIITVILIKYFLSYYLIKQGRNLNNGILIASGKESKMDVYSSLVVLISSICMQFTSKLSVLKYADKIAIIIVAFFIIQTGFNLLKENIEMIIGSKEENEKRKNFLNDLLLSHEGVLEISNLQIMKYGSYDVVWITIVMKGEKSLEEASVLSRHLEKEITKFDNKFKYVSVKIISKEKKSS